MVMSSGVTTRRWQCRWACFVFMVGFLHLYFACSSSTWNPHELKPESCLWTLALSLIPASQLLSGMSSPSPMGLTPPADAFMFERKQCATLGKHLTPGSSALDPLMDVLFCLISTFSYQLLKFADDAAFIGLIRERDCTIWSSIETTAALHPTSPPHNPLKLLSDFSSWAPSSLSTSTTRLTSTPSPAEDVLPAAAEEMPVMMMVCFYTTTFENNIRCSHLPRTVLQRIIFRPETLTGCSLSSLEELHTSRTPEANSYDCSWSHSGRRLFKTLASGPPGPKTHKPKNDFFLTAAGLFNKVQFSLWDPHCSPAHRLPRTFSNFNFAHPPTFFPLLHLCIFF